MTEAKSENKKNFQGEIWNIIGNLKIDAWVQSDNNTVNKQLVSDYFSPVSELENKLVLKLKNKSSAMISFLDTALSKMKDGKCNYELFTLENGYIEILKKVKLNNE